MANDAKKTPAGANEAKGAGPNELSDDQLDKVAGGFGINIIASAVGTSIKSFEKALPGILEAADKPKTDSK